MNELLLVVGLIGLVVLLILDSPRYAVVVLGAGTVFAAFNRWYLPRHFRRPRPEGHGSHSTERAP